MAAHSRRTSCGELVLGGVGGGGGGGGNNGDGGGGGRLEGGGMGVGGSGVVFSTLGLAARKYYGVVLDRAGRPRE